LNFNHPCKELIWTVQRDDLVADCDNWTNEKFVNKAYGCQYFNYTDAGDALPEALNAYAVSTTSTNGRQFVSASGMIEDVPENAGVESQTLSDAAAWVVSETALNMHCWGKNPVISAKLQLNGQDRFSEREGSYFDVVQPFQHHSRHPDTGINVYSFALRPEEHQPSGTCNFSRIDNASLQLILSPHSVGTDVSSKVRVYAVNYNVLRIMSGMGGLAYSN